jgi:deazaflavin-dependent oxidoreductase (nitroreductase family)
MTNHQPDINPYTEKQEKLGTAIIKNFGKFQVFIYRLTGGRLLNKFLGAPVAILTHTGKKTGETRRTPLVFYAHNEIVVLAASKGGMKKPPVWKYNLDANPDCEIQIGSTNRLMTAHVASAAEEEKYWPLLTDIYSGFDEYRKRTEGVRKINLYVLEPRKKGTGR